MSETLETVFFSRPRRAGQRCEVWTASLSDGSRDLVFTTEDMLLEAPNWTTDGIALILNGAGTLRRLDLQNRTIEEIHISGMPEPNNDHVLDPVSESIYLSANDGHLYRMGLRGGGATRLTGDSGHYHFLHGISPDGRELAYVAIEDRDFRTPGRLRTMPTTGGPSRLIDVGRGHCDGPEYSPDGKWIYFNTETFTSQPGHAQIARIRADGSGLERLTESDSVDWFPHLSPNGDHASYLRYAPGTIGHPADQPVEIVTVRMSDWNTPVHSFKLFGGQGSFNVNSWSPDSTRFAYVAYSNT